MGLFKRITILEEKVKELSKIFHIKWVSKTDCGTYSPPYYIKEVVEAEYSDVLLALIDYLGLELDIKEQRVEKKVTFIEKAK